MSKFRKFWTVSVILLILTVACQGPGTPLPQATATTDAPQTGGTATAVPQPAGPKPGGRLTMTLEFSDITTLDPVVPDDNSSIWTILNLYDQIFRVSKDGTSVEPDAISGYSVSPDGLEYSFDLRDGLTFSNGTPVTVEDVVFSLERMLASENWGFLFPEGEVTVEPAGEHAFKMRLQSPYAPLINNLAGFWSSIVPKALVEAQGEAFWEAPVGSGPFMVKEWVKGDHITLARNPHYWEAGKPYLDEVELRPGSDDNTRVLRFQANQLDVLLGVPYNQIKLLDGLDGASAGVSPLMGALRLYPNLGQPPLDDLNVRQALAYAIDRQAIIDAVLFGYGEPATTALIKIPGWWNDQLAGFPYDLEMAKEFMAKSPVPDGFELTTTYTAGSTTDEQIAVLLQQQWALIGVELKLQPVDIAVLTEQFGGGQLQLNQSFWSSSDVIDPAETSAFFTCNRTQPRQGFCDDRINELYLSTGSIMDPAERKAAFFEIQKLGNDNVYWIPMLYVPSRWAKWDYVKDFELLPTGNFRLWEVWLDK